MPQTFWNTPPYAFVPQTFQPRGGNGETRVCPVNDGARMGLSRNICTGPTVRGQVWVKVTYIMEIVWESRESSLNLIQREQISEF